LIKYFIKIALFLKFILIKYCIKIAQFLKFILIKYCIKIAQFIKFVLIKYFIKIAHFSQIYFDRVLRQSCTISQIYFDKELYQNCTISQIYFDYQNKFEKLCISLAFIIRIHHDAGPLNVEYIRKIQILHFAADRLNSCATDRDVNWRPCQWHDYSPTRIYCPRICEFLLSFYWKILEKEIRTRNSVSSYLQLLQASLFRMWKWTNWKPTEDGSMNECNRVALEVIFCLGIVWSVGMVQFILVIWGFQPSAQRVAQGFDMLYLCLMLRPLTLLPSDGLSIAFLHILCPKNWQGGPPYFYITFRLFFVFCPHNSVSYGLKFV